MSGTQGHTERVDWALRGACQIEWVIENMGTEFKSCFSYLLSVCPLVYDFT